MSTASYLFNVMYLEIAVCLALVSVTCNELNSSDASEYLRCDSAGAQSLSI